MIAQHDDGVGCAWFIELPSRPPVYTIATAAIRPAQGRPLAIIPWTLWVTNNPETPTQEHEPPDAVVPPTMIRWRHVTR